MYKPRILKCRYGWLCCTKGFEGRGGTPKLAYEAWVEERARFQRILEKWQTVVEGYRRRIMGGC